MATGFHFITEWQIDAPLEPVYDMIIHCLDWPTWWQGVESVKKLVSGDADGVGGVYRFTWKGRIPYRFTFDMRATGVVPYVMLEGRAEGEVTGTGRW
ncbi:MAG: polyketide cyclase, partial [Betaproteobacteria bacterium]|nr:polyketide cyclase [Betaproteobacteria bacterium]